MRTVMRDLPVQLTDEQIIARADEQASIALEIAELEEEARVTASSYRKRIKPLRKRVRDIAREVKDRRIVAPVECEVADGLVNGSNELRRLDTGETFVEEVEADVDERQESLPGFDTHDGREFSRGVGAIGMGADGLPYDLSAEQADDFRNSKAVTVQSAEHGREVEIVHLVSDETPAPKKRAAGKRAVRGGLRKVKASNGAAQGAA